MFLIVLLYALFASSFSAGKSLLTHTTPIFLTGSRMFIAGILILLYQYIRNPKQLLCKKSHFWLYAQIILFGIYFNYILRFWALNDLPSAKTCFMYNLSPFLSSFYSYIFFNERMGVKKWFGLGIGFIGLIPMLLNSTPAEAATGEFFYISLQELAVILSVALHSYSWIVMRKLVRTNNCSPMTVNGITMTCGGALALLTSYSMDGSFFPVTGVMQFSGLLAYVVIVSNIICYNLYGTLLKAYTATFLSFAGFLSPLFAAFYGWVFLGEAVTWHFYLSTAIVFVGLVIFYQEELLGNKR